MPANISFHKRSVLLAHFWIFLFISTQISPLASAQTAPEKRQEMLERANKLKEVASMRPLGETLYINFSRRAAPRGGGWSVDQFCKDPTYVTPTGDPFSPGECKHDNDPKSNRICRACFRKTTISLPQLALINADTVQTQTYEENEDCFEGPPIL